MFPIIFRHTQIRGHSTPVHRKGSLLDPPKIIEANDANGTFSRLNQNFGWFKVQTCMFADYILPNALLIPYFRWFFQTSRSVEKKSTKVHDDHSEHPSSMGIPGS
jgi:hypothetical protein